MQARYVLFFHHIMCNEFSIYYNLQTNQLMNAIGMIFHVVCDWMYLLRLSLE